MAPASIAAFPPASRPGRTGARMTTTIPAVSATALMSAAPGSGHGADHGRLLIRCQDRPGVVSAISTLLTDAGANIVTLAQHSTAEAGGALFQRTPLHLPRPPA